MNRAVGTPWSVHSVTFVSAAACDVLCSVHCVRMHAKESLEAGWTGRLVVEIANLANLPLRVYVNEGIGQILFFESDEDCAVSYEDRGGKYQGQTGLTFAKV